jgi:Bacterial regulatory proteins, tetR family
MEDAKVMRYPAKETAAKHERIVKEASRLFRERGFEDVGAAEVMKAAGLTHGDSPRRTVWLGDEKGRAPYWIKDLADLIVPTFRPSGR